MIRSKLLLALVIVSVAAVVFLPVYILTFLYPSIDRLLVRDAEQYARNVAGHFSQHIGEAGDSLQYGDITAELKEEIALAVSNFSLEKLKVFSAAGEILYSTTPEEIGGMNDKDYFKSIVMRGKNFSKMVRRNTKTLEGRTVTRDVIETYVPIFGRDRVIGAFEIYYDITDLREMFSGLIRRSTIVIYGVSLLLVSSLLVSLALLSRNISARVRAEGDLARREKEFGELVARKTTEITAANRRLQEDMKKKQAVEHSLRVSEERYRTLVEMAGDAIFIADAESGLITDVNRKATELVGLPASEIVGRHLLTLHPPEDSGLYHRLVKNHYAAAPHNATLYVQHSSGRRIPVEISSSLLDYSGRRIVLGIFRDITERLKTDEELQKSERLKTASILAGGIAHDFNNLLTAILANVSIARMEADGSENIIKRLQSMEEAINRARSLTHQLLTFAKGGKSVRKAIRLGGIIENSALFVLHGTGVKCDCRITADLWPVSADVDQISQVINNIVINAAQAMNGTGLCRISGENVLVTEADRLLLPPGRYIRIDVSDEGHGIPEDTLDRIFDPFYTTKPQGSGLGLSSAYTIVQNHGGRILVDSRVGKGTTFSIYLPASDIPPEEDEADDPARDRPQDLYGGAKILVMDDEEIIREAAASLLGFLGYDVETVEDGEEALRRCDEARAAGKPFDAVILDLTVSGGLGGKETVNRLRELNPDARVIVSSGYYTDPVMTNPGAYGFDAAVPKPYQMEELGRAVKQVLARGA